MLYLYGKIKAVMKKVIRKIKGSDQLFQALLIVFSVFLAFFITEWRNTINDKKELNYVLTALEQEIQINKEILEKLIPYHDTVRNNFAIAFQNDSILKLMKIGPQIDYGVLMQNGILQNIAMSSAWETAKNSNKLTSINHTKLQALTKVYLQQDLTFSPVWEILDLLHSREALDSTKIEENLIMFRKQFSDLRGREIRLLQYYNEALKVLSEG